MKREGSSVRIFLISFIAMALIAIGAGYYKTAVAVEQSATFAIKINGNQNDFNKNIAENTVIDLKQEGLPKKLIQSTVQTIGGTIVNSGDEDLSLQLVSKGFTGKVILSSSDKSLDDSNGKFKSVLKKDESYSITIILQVPRSKTKQCEVNTGIIDIINLKNKNIIGIIPIKIINTSKQGLNNDNTLKDLIQKEVK